MERILKLSIITINYNNKVGLEKTISSILSQTYKDFEWIVIDGGSTDGSKELIENNQTNISYWCSEPDNGIYHAMNKGIVKAKGEYLQFLNSGDVFYSDTVLDSVVPYLNNGDIYMTNMCHSRKLNTPIVKPESLISTNLLNTLIFKGIMHPASYTRKQCFERMGLFNEDLRIISDWWFFFKAIVLYNVPIEYIPVVSVIFDETGISSTHPDITESDKEILWGDNIPLGQLVLFYQDNYDIIFTLKKRKKVFFLYRIYMYIDRLINRFLTK